MPNIGLSELIVILMILVLVFGASRLPQLGEAVGKTIRSFKRSVAENEGIEVEQAKKQVSAQAPAKNAEGAVRDAEIVTDEKA